MLPTTQKNCLPLLALTKKILIQNNQIYLRKDLLNKEKYWISSQILNLDISESIWRLFRAFFEEIARVVPT